MNAIEAILSRASVSGLDGPAPTATEMELIYQSALRASDHGRLRPWRFLVIEGEARAKLGEIFADVYQRKNPESSPEKSLQIASKPLQAPMIIVVIARLKDHPKVPKIEQLLSAGSAAQLILLAAHALGFAGVWKTGDMAYDEEICISLGLTSSEQIVGFLYIGKPRNKKMSLPVVASADFFVHWN